jgi:RNA polymerase-interacting CarD/CdnL/TRCF family regulator
VKFIGNHKTKNFRVGDLVYDQFHGVGVVIDICDQMCDMEIRFRRPEEVIFMNTDSLDMITVVSKATHRKPHNLR